MSSHSFGRGSLRHVPARISAAIALALLVVFIFVQPTQAAPAAPPIEPPISPCNVPGVAVNIDPVGGAIQVRMGAGNLFENLPASIQRITFLDGSVVDAYCIDAAKPRLSGVDVCLVTDISNTRVLYRSN